MPKETIQDNWDKEAVVNTFLCKYCMYYLNYRCRRHAPKGQEGWSAVYPRDFCGDHKLDKSTMRGLS